MRASYFVSSGIVVVAIGCGGAVDTGLFGDPTGGQVPTDGGSTTTDDGGTRTDGGNRFDGGGRFDAGFMDSGTGIKDASTFTDTSPPPGNRIVCNTSAMTCALGDQVCCRSGGGPTPNFNCTAAAGCNAVGDMPIPCDKADDCSKLGFTGDLCCAQTAGGRATSVSCVAPGSCGTNSTNLCDPLAVDPCPNGGSCQVSVTTLPGFHICF